MLIQPQVADADCETAQSANRHVVPPDLCCHIHSAMRRAVQAVREQLEDEERQRQQAARWVTGCLH